MEIPPDNSSNNILKLLSAYRGSFDAGAIDGGGRENGMTGGEDGRWRRLCHSLGGRDSVARLCHAPTTRHPPHHHRRTGPSEEGTGVVAKVQIEVWSVVVCGSFRLLFLCVCLLVAEFE